ncbi:MAG: type II toxin-antitoxin system RelE/ParE family toxin [Clostridiales bacterium]|nr:type II toxin-antitoxin system RelE/ParE family toxin [Clostridiales bacterium]
MYNVILSKKADKQLKKLDKHAAETIHAWMVKNLQNCENPKQHGKALSGNLSGLWRYRVGDYRIIAEIQEEKVVILVLEIGHRKSIYDRSDF